MTLLLQISCLGVYYGLGSCLLQWCNTGTNAAKPNSSEVIPRLQRNDICHIVMASFRQGVSIIFRDKKQKEAFNGQATVLGNKQHGCLMYNTLGLIERLSSKTYPKADRNNQNTSFPTLCIQQCFLYIWLEGPVGKLSWNSHFLGLLF